jgi:hypothetical protein
VGDAIEKSILSDKENSGFHSRKGSSSMSNGSVDIPEGAKSKAKQFVQINGLSTAVMNRFLNELNEIWKEREHRNISKLRLEANV